MLYQLIDLASNVGLHSSVCRASHRYRGSHGFESRSSPDFFQTSSLQLLKLEIYCDDHSLISSSPAVQIWVISYILHIKSFVADWRKLLRKLERGSTLCNKFWLCCLFFLKLTTWRATNLLALWQINQSERCISLTCNECFCCRSTWSRKVKNGKHRPKLAA